MTSPKLIGIGECMIELRDDASGQVRLGFGGDVLNTLVYARRSGLACGFATVTGDEHYGHWLRQCWEDEGLDCALVRHDQGRTPALYIIRNEPSGERHFHYWRDASPFRDLLANDEYAAQLERCLCQASWVYLSGISLALLSEGDRQRLLSILAGARAAGARLAFDPNYRARLWPDRDTAAAWIDRLYANADLALPSLEDEQVLRDRVISTAELAGPLMSAGVQEVVIKDGVRGSHVFTGEGDWPVPAQPAARVVDTTAAGDAFNGAYLAAREVGQSPREAAAAGAQRSARVVQYPGAIMPREEVES